MSEKESNSRTIKRYPKKIIASFQLGNLIGLMMSQLYGQQMPFFYRDFIGLSLYLYVIAQIIFMVYNMINDPLLGYLTDKSKRFTKRWGKRFPWIIMGAIPWAIMPIIMFSSPTASQIGQLAVFLFYLISQCIMDTVFSLYDINRVALFPDKFRDPQDRRIGGTITTILETIGILLGLFIPVLVIELVGPEIGYSLQAAIVSTVSIIFVLLMIPGVREDKEMKERRARLDEEKHMEPFFKGLVATLKDKNFIGYMALYVCYTTAMGLVMASFPFFIRDILQLSKIAELIMAAYIISVIVAAPLWYKLSYRLGVRKVALIGAVMLGLMGIPLLFVPIGPSGLTLTIIILIIAGLTDAAIISMTMPIFSSVIDAAGVRRGKRSEGVYQGTYVFFSRLGIAIHALIFLFIFLLTGYDSNLTNPTALQLLGLKIQISIFPLIIIAIGIIIFKKFYKITDEQIQSNALKLKELDL